MVRAEIITIGDEILYGQILDTNTQWISLELDKLGIKTVRKSSVGDQASEITQILQEASLHSTMYGPLTRRVLLIFQTIS